MASVPTISNPREAPNINLAESGFQVAPEIPDFYSWRDLLFLGPATAMTVAGIWSSQMMPHEKSSQLTTALRSVIGDAVYVNGYPHPLIHEIAQAPTWGLLVAAAVLLASWLRSRQHLSNTLLPLD